MAVFLRKYGVTLSGGTVIRVPMVKRGVVDFAVGADWTPASGDVKVSKDGGAAANIGTLPTAVAMGNGAFWEFTLTGTELSAKTVVVTVADSATKAVEDQCFVVETYGDTSAMYQADFSAANLPANVVQFGGVAATTASGRPEVNTTHIGGTSQTARDIGASVLLSSGTGTGQISLSSGAVLLQPTQTGVTIPTVTSITNRVTANTDQLAGQTVTAAAGVTFPTSVASPTNITAATGVVLSGVTHTGAVIPNVTTVTNLTNAPTSGDLTATMKASISGLTIARVTLTDTLTTYTGNTPQTGDSYARIGLNGAGLTSLAPASTALSTATWTGTRAGYLDNLSAGVVPTASQTAAAVLAAGDVDGFTLEQTLKLCLSALAAKLSGAGTTTITIRAADDSKSRITATVDASGNRSAVTLDATG